MSHPTPTPVLHGFNVTWDDLNRVWVAISASGRYRFVGRDQHELEARRDRLFGQILTEFVSAIAEVRPGRES